VNHRLRRLVAVGVASVACIAVATTANASGGDHSRHAAPVAPVAASELSGKVLVQLLVAKALSAKYLDVRQAEKDGYVTEPGPDGKPVCVASPDGGMGIHYVQPQLAAQPPDYRKPAMLTYEPQPNGRLRLVALEYFKVAADQTGKDDSDRPYVFQQPFDGPMAGHSPGMPVHYDLHVWLWKHNPSGLFAMWNPNVRCPS
jgi:hypothetical protein